MNSRRAVFVALALPVVAFFLWMLWPRHDADYPAIQLVRRARRIAHSAVRNPQSEIQPLGEVSHAADNLNSPATDIRADLRLVAEVLQTYRSNFPHDGNPVGSNAEITAALTGRNKRRVAFIAPNHRAINHDGELCDRWGTPFFFHAESGTRMAIRSAGPDKKMWTDDDIELSP